jgi:hypothetical protein
MKFSLKQLILFVTFAAMICGVAEYANRHGRAVQTAAEAERTRAEQARQPAQWLIDAFPQKMAFGNGSSRSR